MLVIGFGLSRIELSTGAERAEFLNPQTLVQELGEGTYSAGKKKKKAFCMLIFCAVGKDQDSHFLTDLKGPEGAQGKEDYC